LTGKARALEQLRFINRFTRELPADPVTGNYCRQVSNALFSSVNPTPVSAPRLVAITPEVAEQIGLNLANCDDARLASVLSGNELLDGMQPYAMAYGGHQFGHWAGQLGDGRAINLGEVLAPDQSTWTLQLKGAGPTPYSRQADGRAVLRSSVREFLCSEAMHHLGVPTTRALSLVLTGDTVVRDMFYDGHPKAEAGAVVCRVSPSFVRFGHFELPAARGDMALLEKLLHFVISTDRPDLAGSLSGSDAAGRRSIYLDWFAGVCESTQHMILQWMRVGFVHGVMNTDNMSVLGLTIDYGPYGWIDDYNPDWTPNTTDAEQRRYRFGQQPAVARWNLYQLANAIYPLIKDADALQAILDGLPEAYDNARLPMQAAKLGLPEEATRHPDFPALLADLERLLRCQPVDMTIFYRKLIDYACQVDSATGPEQSDWRSLTEVISPAFYPVADADSHGVVAANLTIFQHWEQSYRQFLRAFALNATDRRARMSAANPAFVLRNYLVQQAIDGLEQGDSHEFDRLLHLLRQPYDNLTGQDQRFGARRPAWASNRAGCSMLSCSS
jgi:uncharacterized protein YdiU (UPF0061 family)